MVTFRNLTEEPVRIPSGTVLTSTGLPGVRFETTEAGEVEAGLKATIDLPVRAEKAGVTGNVEAGTIKAIEGNLGLLVTATNAEPTTGGRDRMMNAPSEGDLSRLHDYLLAELEQLASSEMKAMLAPGDQIFSDTLKVEQVLEEKYDPPLGQPNSKVELSMRVEFTASYASEGDLTELADTVLSASLPEGFVAAQTSLDFEPASPQQTDEKGVTRWMVKVSRPLEKQVNAIEIIPLVQGRSMAAARAQLEENLDLPNSPEIRLKPAWWPWLPLIPFNITVETR
jgi:hypothetical protein